MGFAGFAGFDSDGSGSGSAHHQAEKERKTSKTNCQIRLQRKQLPMRSRTVLPKKSRPLKRTRKPASKTGFWQVKPDSEK